METTQQITVGERSVTCKVVRSARRKRTIAFSIESESRLKLIVPARTSARVIQRLLQEREGWIARQIARLQKTPRPEAPRFYTDGESIPYMGHRFRLSVTHDEGIPQGCYLKPRRLRVNICGTSLSAKALREEVRLEIALWLKKSARAKLEKRLRFQAARLGVNYRRFLTGQAEHRWGSCSAQNDIRLNWRLIMAPMSVIDYVAVHELCHVAHKNHGPRFWQTVTAALSDAKECRRQLRRLGPALVLE